MAGARRSSSRRVGKATENEEKGMVNETSEKNRVHYRGRYYAEYVRVRSGTDHQRTVQEALDSGSKKGWHLVGVEGGVPDCTAILFWDTEPPNFGRTNRA
jgi:hypothetical protein